MKTIEKSKQQLISEIRHLKAENELLKVMTKNDIKADHIIAADQAQLFSIFDTIGIGISQINPRMEILTLNKQMARWFPDVDVTQKPLCYQNFRQPPLLKICDNCPTTLTFFDGANHETLVTRKIGATDRQFRILSSPVKNERGKVVSVFELVEDITERMDFETALRNSEQKYRGLTENLNVGVYRADVSRDGKFLEINPEIVRMFGYSSKNELLNIKIRYLYANPEDRAAFLERVISQGSVKNVQLNMKKKNGTPFPVLVSTVAIRDEKGKVQYLDGIIEDLTQRLEMEKSIIQSENLMRAVLESTGDGILVVDNQGRVSHYNQKFARMWRIPDSIVKSGEDAKLLKFVLDQLTDPDSFIKKIEQLYQSTETSLDVLFFKDGRIFERFSSPLIFEGTISGRVWNFRDITEQKRAELMLRQSEEEFRLVWESSSLGMRLTDEAGIMVKVNDAFCRIFGMKKDQLEGKPLAIIYQAQKRQHILQRHHERFRARKVKTLFQQKLELWNGKTVWLEVCSSFLTRSGQPPLLLGIFQDITQSKAAKAALESSEQRLNIIFRSAPDAYFSYDPMGRLVDCNIAAEKLLGYSADELLGKSFLKLNLLPKNQIPKAVKILSKNAMGIPTGPDEFTLIRKDGTRIIVEIRAYPVQIQGETLILGIAHDITERKTTEIRLQKLLNEKEVLLKEVYHRVKNNFQVISSLLYLQLKKIDSEPARLAFMASLNRIKTMALVHEKLYQSADLAEIDFSDYVKTLATNLYQSYISDHEKVDIKFDLENVTLGIDQAIPCGLIVNELVTNALKYAFQPSFPNGSELFIALKQSKKNTIVLVVKDNGVGISPDLNIKESKTLGLNLVNMLSENQLEGKLELERSKGVSFKLSFQKSTRK
ncbi:MAG: PAS domain S-box protein [bacterium]|nr:PAS domain S-box protein [bacterium]